MTLFDSIYKNVLITGGAGAIGSNLVRLILKNTNAKIIVLDNLVSGYKDNLPIDDRVIFIYGNICDNAMLNKCAEYKVDVIYHLAAFFANQNSVEHPIDDLMANTYGTVNLLEFSRRNDVKRFIYFSSSCVYRTGTKIMEESDVNYELETPYAISKLSGEHYAKYYYNFHRVPVVIFRIFNSYGPGERPGQYRNVIPNFFARAIRGESLVITGTGEETRCFTYVDSVIEAALNATLSEHAPGRVINVGINTETKIIDLANKINAMTGNKSPIEYVPRRLWDKTSKRMPNNQLATTLLNFESKLSLDEGLKNTYEWIKSIVI